MDVNSAFLNGFPEEESYVKQPRRYEIDSQEDKVYKLKKELYGLKQAHRVWYSRIDEYLNNNGFIRSPSEPTLYTKVNKDGKILIVCLYVDDLIFNGDLSMEDFKTSMKREFDMTHFCLMKYFLGIEVTQFEDGIFICQFKYPKDILKRFRMENGKPVVTPIAIDTKLSKDDHGSDIDPTLFKKKFGSLMYLTTARPNIMFGVSLISRFMESLKSTHWLVEKRILRYGASTTNYGILYASDLDFKLTVYTHSDLEAILMTGGAHLGMCSVFVQV